MQIITSWWFEIFFIFTPILGNDSIWRAYFSNGLKPPTRLISDLGCSTFFGTTSPGFILIVFRRQQRFFIGVISPTKRPYLNGRFLGLFPKKTSGRFMGFPLLIHNWLLKKKTPKKEDHPIPTKKGCGTHGPLWLFSGWDSTSPSNLGGRCVFFWMEIELWSQLSHEKKTALLSIESWLFNGTPYNGLYNLHITG